MSLADNEAKIALADAIEQSKGGAPGFAKVPPTKTPVKAPEAPSRK